MLIDDVIITVVAGNGGRGAVAFNKNLMSLGPSGGSGGNGGSVYVEGASNLNALSQFRYKKSIVAKNGAIGGKQFNDGRDGDSVTVKVPVGTVVHTIDSQQSREVLRTGERLLVAQGGHGGKGNFHFRSPKNTSPRRFQEGLPGERFMLQLELKLIADIGFIGLPNAGKSSLLNELTRARSKTAHYPFTTLEPNLGTYYELILADIPGLIEGASGGKGLGAKFLRHIERTKILFHLVSAESVDVAKDYKTIRKELAAHARELTEKSEYVLLTKIDTASPTEVKKKTAALQKARKGIHRVLVMSIYDWDSIENVKRILNDIKESALPR